MTNKWSPRVKALRRFYYYHYHVEILLEEVEIDDNEIVEKALKNCRLDDLTDVIAETRHELETNRAELLEFIDDEVRYFGDDAALQDWLLSFLNALEQAVKEARAAGAPNDPIGEVRTRPPTSLYLDPEKTWER
jgi:adenylate kinase family enzyme